MKHISKEQVIPHANSESCKALEYGNNGKSDVAVIEIDGSYPEVGRSRNKLAYAAMVARPIRVC